MRPFPTFPPLALLALCLLAACSPKTTPRTSAVLEQKCQPNEHFAWQRAFPDTVFDWRGWQKALRRARQSERLRERSAAACSPLQATDWTLQGPGNVGGRVNSLIVHPQDPGTLLAGFSGGGIFKTQDGGENWRPVFDEHAELSIGDLTFDPSDPNVVYAGTGDANMPSYVFNGDGIYKSSDAGEHWQHLGLAQVGVISKIVVHPDNPQTLFVAAMGNPYVRTPERGIYKSTDGGLSWQKVLFVSEQAGASDLLLHPAQPNVLYAAFWDRIRSNRESVIHGPHARIYKSTDGGATWAQLGGGLPSGPMGRTGLTMSQQNPDKLYAVYVDSFSRVGAVLRTVDGGASWDNLSIVGLENAYADFGWYFGKLRVAPTNDEDLYLLGVQLWRRAPGSTNWVVAGAGHADQHDLHFLPSGRRYAANDGGVYLNEPGNTGWVRCLNLPTTQFYRTTFNPNDPQTYYAGAQDNGIRAGNAAGYNSWGHVFGGDGFRCAFSPLNPDLFWVETQNGAIHKTNDGGANWALGQTCLGTGDRCNWDMPFFLSQHDPERRFAATYRVYESEGEDGPWTSSSQDLTDGNIFGARFHTVSALEESPLEPGKLLAGTSDGNLWRRQPNGTWTNITTGLPERYVTSVHGSHSAANRIFVTHSGFRDNENLPHVHRSDDNGQTWTDISGDLPPMPANDILVLPGHADSVLFVATDAGVYCTLNGGANWGRLGTNMPFVPVFDLELNPALQQVQAATHARGLWTFPVPALFETPSAPDVVLSGRFSTVLGYEVWLTQWESNWDTVVYDLDSIYLLPPVPGCRPYHIRPSSDHPGNPPGLTTFDLVLISKHILALDTLDSPYQLIAADASGNGVVSTFDIVELRKVILGIYNELPNNKVWRFVPAAYVFPDPTNPFVPPFPESIEVQAGDSDIGGLNFMAIQIGDVNALFPPFAMSPPEERRRGVWPIWAKQEPQQAENEQTVLLSAPMDGVAAAQFSLSFDPAALRLLRVEPLFPGMGEEHFNLMRASAGSISCSVEVPPTAALRGELVLFRLVFEALRGGAVAPADIRLGALPTPALAFAPDGGILQPSLQHLAPDLLVSTWPNPFGAAGFWLRNALPQAGEYALQVFDNQGKMIWSQALAPDAVVHVPAANFPVQGAYAYRVLDARNGRALAAGRLLYSGAP
jgi:photosystem II stability/assembly factor-like uncharacterized protein